jgi:hypothetical protein
MKLLKIFIISSIISSLISCSHQKQQFKVDNSVSLTIDSISKANMIFESSLNPKFSFHVKKTFEYERFGQNGMDLAYFLKASSDKLTEVYVSGMSECYLDKDTINLMGILGYESRMGLIISIFGDTFNSQLRLIAAGKIYSKTEKKSDLQDDIILNSDSISLTLTEKPKFISGSNLKGKMDVKFEPFYQVDSSNRLSKITPELSIIFDTEIR